MSGADPSCLFCRIVAGELPATIVAEDERTVAFMDINPATRGHALVVPRAHSADLLEVDPEDLAACAAAAKRVAGRAKAALAADGVNLLNSCGAAAWQTVFHFHVHVIPRYDDDPLRLPWVPGPGDADEIAAAGAALRDAGVSVRLQRDGSLAELVLDSPPLNLFDRELFAALRVAVDELAADPPRGLLVRAEGRVVSGGVDVHHFDGLAPADAAALWRELLALVQTVEELPLPTVFAAHALTLTAAFELALACDLLLAVPSARFGLVERVVGLTPAMGGTQRLAERAGPARARELVMTGGLFDAATLERWGVVNRVLDEDGFEDAARAFARDLADGPTRAHAATKSIVRAVRDGGARGADAVVPELAGDLFATEDLRAAVRSFLEHGPGRATFEGR